jgi:hypothetical protein
MYQCADATAGAAKQRIAEWKQVHDSNVFEDSDFAASFNVAPQSMQPVVRLDKGTGEGS